MTHPKTGGIFIYKSTLTSPNDHDGGTIINKWLRQYSGDWNALWFEVIGDGSADDQDKINKAVKYAAIKHTNLFFPSGTYKFNSGENVYGIPCGIRLEGKTDFKMYGEKGTLFTSDKVEFDVNETTIIDNWSFILILNCVNITIEGIKFENTHGNNNTTTSHPMGIYIIGSESTSPDNITLISNSFSGFYNSIVMNGGKNNRILENIFLSPNGHDDSAVTEEPAVFINVTSSDTGSSRDLIVRGNYAEGYSGTNLAGTSGKRSMDGFYFGYADGAIIENNTLLYFGVEAIYALGFEKKDGYDSEETDIRPTIIRENYIDSTKPKDSISVNNFGIRADGSNYIIENNYIRAGYGILCYGVENDWVAKNVVIRNNRYFAVAGVDHWYPIFVQGFIPTDHAMPAEDYLIENNEINIVGIDLTNNLDLFTFADANYINVKNNKIYIDSVTQNSNDITIYKFAQNCSFLNYGEESIIGSYDNLYIDLGANSNLNYYSLKSLPSEIQVIVSYTNASLTIGTAKVSFRMPYAMALTKINASLESAGTGSGVTKIDINKNGTTILSTKLQINSGAKTSTTASIPAVISGSILGYDNEITIDIDAITSGANAKGLKLWLIGSRI